MRLRWLGVLLCLGMQSVWAANTFSCTPVVVKTENKNIVLPGVNQPKDMQVYFFNNISKESLWLDHPVAHPSASAGWSSYVRPGNWSAIVVNRKDFVINCAVIHPGQVDYKDCSKAIAICTPKQGALNTKQKGSYWLVEDKSWDDFVKGLAARGMGSASHEQPSAR